MPIGQSVYFAAGLDFMAALPGVLRFRVRLSSELLTLGFGE